MTGRYAVRITGATVREGDGIDVGGVPMTVSRVILATGGRRVIEFNNGASLSIGPRIALTATRAGTTQGWRWSG